MLRAISFGPGIVFLNKYSSIRTKTIDNPQTDHRPSPPHKSVQLHTLSLPDSINGLLNIKILHKNAVFEQLQANLNPDHLTKTLGYPPSSTKSVQSDMLDAVKGRPDQAKLLIFVLVCCSLHAIRFHPLLSRNPIKILYVLQSSCDNAAPKIVSTGPGVGNHQQ